MRNMGTVHLPSGLEQERPIMLAVVDLANVYIIDMITKNYAKIV